MTLMKPRRRWLKWLAMAGGVGLGLLFAAYLAIGWRIGAGVREAAAEAQIRHGGDAVEALLGLVEDASATWVERNRAVWALGQLGDARALEPLRALQTDGACDHERRLCEHELGKAVKLLEGGLNASAWIWRWKSPSPRASSSSKAQSEATLVAAGRGCSTDGLTPNQHFNLRQVTPWRGSVVGRVNREGA